MCCLVFLIVVCVVGLCVWLLVGAGCLVDYVCFDFLTLGLVFVDFVNSVGLLISLFLVSCLV